MARNWGGIQTQAESFALSPHIAAQSEEQENRPSVVQHDEIRLMHPEETGLEYPVIVKPNPKGDGYDIIKSLG